MFLNPYASKFYSSISQSASKLMVFYFSLAWNAIKWFPYMFIAGTLAAGIHIRVEVELN